MSKIDGHLGSFVIVPHYNIVNSLVHVFCETDLHISFGHVTGALSTAERSYPTSEVRGSGREYQTAMAQERLRSCPASEVRGGDERSYPKPLSPRPGAVAQRTNPTSKEPRLRGSGGPRGAIPL